MKNILLILFIPLCSILQAQIVDSLGTNDDYHLNIEEAIYLNKSVDSQLGVFDFNNKRVIFSEGNSARIIPKSDYFERLVKPALRNGKDIVNLLYILSKEEKIDSGGFHAIIVAWSKTGLTKKRKKAIIKEMNKMVTDKT